MVTDQTQVLACRWILPVQGEPIQGGWVRFRGRHVLEVAAGRPPAGATDLGDVAMLPGLVNAHTHLEFSDLCQPIGNPGVALEQWIAMVIAARRETTPAQKRQAIAEGIRQCRQSGVRLVGEITTPPCDYELPPGAPELITFAEVLGLSAARGAERLSAARSHQEQNSHGAWSPHAPYSTSRECIEQCVSASIATRRPLAMHVAESPAERELLTHGGGPLADVLRTLGVWREGLFPWGDEPFIDLIDRLSGAPCALLIHGNDLRDHEIRRLAESPSLSVVYCPRTHAFFGHDRHPVDKLLSHHVRVALGTDSRASNPDLNLWREVQFLLNHRTDLDPAAVIRMATWHGAQALGRPDIGRIAVGCDPGWVCVPTHATTPDELYEDLSRGEICHAAGESI